MQRVLQVSLSLPGTLQASARMATHVHVLYNAQVRQMNPNVTQTDGTSIVPAWLVYTDSGLPLADGELPEHALSSFAMYSTVGIQR
jgi:hypothetical protein